MATRMLIDARHTEETRVAVLKGNRIEEFDFESADKKQIKGNIYLAKVTRVEPSLQAAFVDFGGNRHGFLAFSEIHPDYYQIPKEDREALLAEEAAHAEEEAALRAAEDAEDDIDERADDDDGDADDDGGLTEVDAGDEMVATIEDGHVENGFEFGDAADHDAEAAPVDEADGEEADAETDAEDSGRSGKGRRRPRRQGRGRSKEADDLRARRMALRRRYKIQDVIQRRQVLLVQVVKEERGNKGAALTTYLSLAGRYCVLMPNSSHGGGISRKISSAADRKRLKAIISEMSLPKSMGCIVRTAGLSRTKTEIKRDFDYLARLWDELRERTLASSAPALIHSDSDLIKRAIRDIYNRDIEEVIVEGEDGYRAAKDFMKLLMPSHARKVKPYADPVPLFQRFGAEDQLTAMYDPVVQLRSGGYIVINPTEALVSIDINSGRATKEHGIEATAVNTNLEAAQEIARQLRLRDMAGLVVIDFIDMEYSSNIRKVEKAMKEALKHDRARIQVGRISSFGLMEMSRQRLRTGVLEATTRECPHCDGTGLVRTASSAGLSALRMIEDEAARGKGTTISLFASTEATIYLLNAKRADLTDIEARYGVVVEVIPEGENEGAKMRAVSSGPRRESMPVFQPIAIEEDDEDIPEDDYDAESEADEADDEDSSPRKRRRRRRSRSRDRQPRDDNRETRDSEDAEDGDGEARDAEPESDDGDEAPKKRRRRGGRRRRGRGRSEEGAETEGEEQSATDSQGDDAAETDVMEADAVETVIADADAAPPAIEASDGEPPQLPEPEAPKPKRRRKTAAASKAASEDEVATAAEVEAPPKPKRTRRKKADEAPAVDAASDEAAATEVADAAEAKPAKPARTRRKKSEAPAEPEQQAEAVVVAANDPDTSSDAGENAQPASAPAAADASSAATDPAASGSTPADDEGEGEADGTPRRGWWQRTFGQ